ncbi:hypothetical protein C789_3493 [Microcystis aeruginosa FACHB-905 = DIANCHI905]|nr:hypothetical protein C789_3493 [Microcystis aeruginosa FACHB-905 = DIANCHI905]
MSDTPLIKGGLRGDQRPPYQGGIKGGSNLKSIFNLIITSYLHLSLFTKYLVFAMLVNVLH